MLINAGIAMAAACGARIFDLQAWLVLFTVVNVAAAIGFVTLYNLLMGQVRPHQSADDYALLQSTDAAVAMLVSLATLQVAHYLGYPHLLLGLAVIACVCLWPARKLCQKLQQQPAGTTAV